MKILFSTTIGHNPGDEIILAGVQNLIRHGLKQEFESIYYNRNPDLQLGTWREPIRNPIGNYMTSPVDLSHVDRVILAGSPEFFGGPMKGLYDALRVPGAPRLPFLALGVGLGDKTSVLDEPAREILSNAQVITRSAETVEFLGRYQIQAQALPCPALFSSMFTADPVHDETLFIVQRPGNGWHEIKASLLDGLDKQDQLLCLHLKEYHYFKSQGFERVSYAASGTEALQIIRKYPRVMSTRLHGAIGAFSLGIPTTVVADEDFRIETATAQFGGYLPVRKSFEHQHILIPTSEEIKEYKWEQWNKWVSALKEIW